MTYIPRIQSFGRGAVRLTARPGEFLDVETLKAYAPTIFAEEPHGSRSARFAHIPTHDMLSALMHEGFMPTGVAVGGSSDADKRAHTKHMIRFRRVENLLPAGGVAPEVVLKNAHDGTSQYRLMFGLFRAVCMNGLVVADRMLSDVTVPHRGNATSKVIEGSYKVLGHSDEVEDRIAAMKGTSLPFRDEMFFYRKALEVRYGDKIPDALRERPELVGRPRRGDDRGTDLWRIFNRVQENLIRGGVEFDAVREVKGVEKTIHETTRPVRSVDGDIQLNRELWKLAVDMMDEEVGP